ncbi:hypothetical protein P3L10_009288 [Capsicum annuum]
MALFNSYSFLLLVFLAIIGLAFARNLDEKVKVSCYEICRDASSNDKCLAFCIRRSFDNGGCILDPNTQIASCCCVI